MLTNSVSCRGAILVLLAGTIAHGQGPVAITSDAVNSEVADTFTAGEVVPITLFVKGAQDSPIVGVSLELACGTDAVRIQDVTFNPAFGLALGEVESSSLPGSTYRGVRVQSPVELDQDLGAGDASWLARVDVEIMNSNAFESFLSVKAHAVELGARRGRTSVLGRAPQPASRADGRIVIRNTSAAPAEQWTEAESSVAMEVRPLGGGEPVTVLSPNSTYELHYRTPSDKVNGFLLSVSGAVGTGLDSAVAAPSGPWANPERFEHLDTEAAEGLRETWDSEGSYLLDLVGGFWTTQEDFAASQGHLCNFTSSETGSLRFDLFMDWTDPESHEFVWMRAQADYTVQEASAEEEESDEGE